MRILFGLLRVDAMAGLAARSVRNCAQTGWRLCYRSGLVACAAVVIALSSTYQAAEAQIKIVDVNFPGNANALLDEVDGILNKEKCLFEFRAEELTRQVNAAYDEMFANRDTLDDAHRAKNVSNRDYKRITRAANIHLIALQSLIERIRDFPRCLNFVGRPPGGSTPQVGSPGGSSAKPSDRNLRTTNIRGVGTGLSFGFNFNGNVHMLGQTETSKATGAVTHDFKDSSQGPGAGFNARYLFPFGNNGILLGPYAAFDYLGQETNHILGGGFFLGNTINSNTTVGLTAGINATPQAFLFTNFGASWIDRDQRLNFLGRTTAVDSSAPGVTVGGGMDFRPIGSPMSITIEVGHTFVKKRSVSNPDSPGFIYDNDSGVTTAKVGIRVPLVSNAGLLHDFGY